IMSLTWPDKQSRDDLLDAYIASSPVQLRNLQYSILAHDDPLANRLANLFIRNDVKKRFHTALYHLAELPYGGNNKGGHLEKAKRAIGLPSVPKDMRIVDWVLERWRQSSPVLGL